MNISRRALFGKLNTQLFQAIESATAFAKLRGNSYVEIVHWLHQIWQIPGNDLHRIAAHFKMDPAQVEKDLTVALAQLPGGASGVNDFGHLIELSIERAWVYASLSANDRCIRGAWLLAAMLQTPELRRVLLSISASFQKIPPLQVADDFPLIVAGSIEDADRALDATDMANAVPGEASGAMEAPGDGKSALAKYCTDLTFMAREGRIDPVVGREQEIRTMVDILLRRRQNNPLLTGEAANALLIGKPGTGKSHIAKAVAYQATPQGYDVRYVEADTEFARYGLASSEEQAQLLKGWVEPDLLVLDDLFLARRIADVSAELLQAIVHQRYKLRRSIVITSNRVVQDWGKYLADATMSTTILDRLMHRCAMLEFEGKSYRLKEAAARIVMTGDSS